MKCLLLMVLYKPLCKGLLNLFETFGKGLSKGLSKVAHELAHELRAIAAQCIECSENIRVRREGIQQSTKKQKT